MKIRKYDELVREVGMEFGRSLVNLSGVTKLFNSICIPFIFTVSSSNCLHEDSP